MSLYDVCHAAGGMTAYEWNRDPKRLGFILARYKFVAKMFAGMHCALEVGCADGFGTRLVRQEVKSLTAIDIDAASIEFAQENDWAQHPTSFRCLDFLDGTVFPARASVDGVYCLDVIEHIHQVNSDRFLTKLHQCAKVCIIGTPSFESQAYASTLSKQGHVNCYSGDRLRTECLRHWSQVFMFGMNDETLHTGFLPMSHYLFALCVR